MAGVADKRAEKDDRQDSRARKRERLLGSIPKITVEAVEHEAFVFCLHHILQSGGAIRLGATRDGGAWAIGVYGDGPQPYTEYVKATESLTEYLYDLGTFFQELNKHVK
jgi:hypothetical protein